MVMKATLDSLGAEQLAEREVPDEWMSNLEMRAILRVMYEVAARRWDRIGQEHPGSARLWRDLADRASHTAGLLSPPDGRDPV